MYLEVSVKDAEIVESLETDNCLDKNAPNLWLLEEFFLLFVLDNLLV